MKDIIHARILFELSQDNSRAPIVQNMCIAILTKSMTFNSTDNSSLGSGCENRNQASHLSKHTHTHQRMHCCHNYVHTSTHALKHR